VPLLAVLFHAARALCDCRKLMKLVSSFSRRSVAWRVVALRTRLPRALSRDLFASNRCVSTEAVVGPLPLLLPLLLLRCRPSSSRALKSVIQSVSAAVSGPPKDEEEEEGPLPLELFLPCRAGLPGGPVGDAPTPPAGERAWITMELSLRARLALL
jgi:hypothetical protein